MDQNAELTAFLQERHPGATLLLAGSFARGTATPYSDFDVIAVQDTGVEPTRTAYRFGGRLVEVFCHTEGSLTAWMAQNTEARKKSMASMLVDAKLLWGDEALLSGLREQAAAVVAAGPPGYTAAEDEDERRWITETLDDVLGLGEGPEVLLLGSELFLRVLNYTLVKNRRWVTNGKYYRSALDEIPVDRDAFSRALDALGAYDTGPLVEVTEMVLARFGGRLYEDGWAPSWPSPWGYSEPETPNP